MDGSAPERREVVIPGDLLDGRGSKPGSGTFKEGGRIYAARLGVVSERDGFVSVIPLTGRYIPQSRDVIMGKHVRGMIGEFSAVFQLGRDVLVLKAPDTAVTVGGTDFIVLTR